LAKQPLLAQSLAADFLSRIRGLVNIAGLDPARLPRWVTAASVRLGRLPTSILVIFDDSTHRDTFHWLDAVKSDLQVFLECPEFQPVGAALLANKKRDAGLVVVSGTYGKDKRTVLDMVTERTSLFDAGIAGYHAPTALMNVFVRLAAAASAAPPELQAAMTDAMRFVPFALYVHESDIADADALWGRCRDLMLDVLQSTVASELGDHYASLPLDRPFEALRASKEKTVIVLGKGSGPELSELCVVRDYLRSKGYDAWLVMDFPDYPSMSDQEKVAHWTNAARFSVMVDRTPSGHILEYGMLMWQRNVLAVLRPKGRRSTYMIGDAHGVDVNHIKEFEFEQSPLECLDEAIQWAEMFIQLRIDFYEINYPWRQ